MKKQTLSIVFSVLITFLSCLVVPPFLPAQVPIHWDVESVVDDWCDKLFLFLFPALQPVITIDLQFVGSTGPRRENMERFVSTCSVSLMVLCLPILGVCLIAAISAWKPDVLDVPTTITSGLGFLFAVMDNLTPKIRQNYFIDIRTPRTLENEDN